MITARKTLLALASAAFLLMTRGAATCDGAAPERDNSLRGKVFCGYQGWFGAPGDGTQNGWDNYNTSGGVFEPGACVIEYWPDLNEFDNDEKYPTDFRRTDGSVAHVFSSANVKTVDRHFQWMQEYGIDGVFLQRFGWALKHAPKLDHRNQVYRNVRRSAAKHGRLWALMYDLSSLAAGDIEKYVLPDFRRLVENDGLATDPAYARYDDKPVVGVWGVGFSDQRDYRLQECRKLVEFLKHDPVCGNHAVLLGVPYFWRDGVRDAVADPLFHDILKEADIVSPWSVGRYQTSDQARELMRSRLPGDVRWTRERNLGYMPVIFPGFSWHNLSRSAGRSAPLNQIPRERGRFLWSQAEGVRQAGLDMVYVAMFDEMNEGTCIFKCSNVPPSGASPFLTYGAERLPNDHYLWLTGQIGRLLRDELSSQREMPKRETQ